MWGADTVQIDNGVPATQIIPADPHRRRCTVITDANQAGIVYLTPSAGVSSGGIRIVPGAGFEFFTGAAIYARSVGGDQTVTIQSESSWSC